MVHTGGNSTFIISYTISAKVSFVAKNYVDVNRAYISPPGTYLYPAGQLNTPVTVQFIPFGNWSQIATGLEPVKGKPNTFSAPDYDLLYDCPVLIGNLDSFPSFSVKNIPHFFYAYKADAFDRDMLMDDLKKIITTASGIIGDIPYSHYTFLGIGPGGGGIEHLNSASVAFTGKELNDPATRIRTYHFLSHEYFHHYNVKRIRPIELGPFDYDNGSKTKMLWLSEGVTVYYENIILKRAGLISTSDMLHSFSASIKAYEDKPGRWFQTPAEASFSTWDDGPFGRTGDDYYKTISPYDKGPALGLLLDFKIRHSTANRKSLDDLMRLLYTQYYLSRSRGFSETEFRQAAEEVAGVSLADFFDYIYTLKPVDYTTYLGYAGLIIDTVSKVMPQAWHGLVVIDKNDSLRVRQVEWDSPAWKAGIRTGAVILTVNGQNMNAQQFNALVKVTPSGNQLNCKWMLGQETKEMPVKLVTKMERSYEILTVSNPAALQSKILKSWLGE
jgi:predicted metalloprotease with PDZ domain